MREIAALSGLAVAGVAASWVLVRLRGKAKDPERRRRALIHASGRLIDGVCTDVQNSLIHYRYVWRGVEYAASQDISAFGCLLPDPPDRIVGSITVKFLPKQPSNSIVVCEEWNGFRRL